MLAGPTLGTFSQSSFDRLNQGYDHLAFSCVCTEASCSFIIQIHKCLDKLVGFCLLRLLALGLV